MSIAIMEEAMVHAPVANGTLLVLIALANNADDEHRQCWPGIKSLAARSRLSTRQVVRCLDELKALGILLAERNASPKGTNLYTIQPRKRWRSDNMSPGSDVTLATGRCDISDSFDVTPMSPKPSLEPSIEPSYTPQVPKGTDLFASQQISEGKDSEVSKKECFEEWFKTYPKRDGSNPRKPAETAFKRALKKITYDELMARTRSFAKSCGPTPSKFTPQAATWLNQERWSEHEPSSAPGAGDDFEARMKNPFIGLSDGVRREIAQADCENEKRKIALDWQMARQRALEAMNEREAV